MRVEGDVAARIPQARLAGHVQASGHGNGIVPARA
jgi:hypothetical protein